ncbi:hypothetical protein [Roseateles amylovorans]|uniref:Peptidase C80 domain-containing protein n=1 Tax=Roseateles amylovorans TaxID=2978473 RepID=A0ABY6AVX1_9BURK|nr:hypothetical protein [Roseateles amylovorans]UXH76832.1 hypothetical protein N4261_17565 [Roseateles amylovorans]
MPISLPGLPPSLPGDGRMQATSATPDTTAAVESVSSAADLMSGKVAWHDGAAHVLADALVQSGGWPQRYALGVDSGDGCIRDAVPEGGGARRVVVARQGEGWTSASGPVRSTGAPAEDFAQAALDGLEQMAAQDGVSAYAQHPPAAPPPPPKLQGALASFQLAAPPMHRPRVFGRAEVLTPPQSFTLADPTMPKAVPSRPGGRVEGLKADVAATLGRLLNERYQWARPVALDGRAFDRLAAKAASHTGGNLSWQLRVDKQGRHVELALHQGTRALAAAPVLDLRRIASGATLMRMNVDDDLGRENDVLDDRFNAVSTRLGAVRAPMRQGLELDQDRTLKRLPARQPLVLIGHGDRLEDAPKGQPYRIDRLGDRSAEDIAELLAAQGLDKRYQGTIYLVGCGTASGFGSPHAFADRLRTLLADKGYERLSVAGTPGAARIDEGGQVFSSVDAVVTDTRATLDRTRQLVERLKAARAQASEEAKAQGGGAGAGKPQNEETRVLTRVIRSELDYLQQIKDIKADRRAVARGTLAHDNTSVKQLRGHGVREWWGVFGPRKTHKPTDGG